MWIFARCKHRGFYFILLNILEHYFGVQWHYLEKVEICWTFNLLWLFFCFIFKQYPEAFSVRLVLFPDYGHTQSCLVSCLLGIVLLFLVLCESWGLTLSPSSTSWIFLYFKLMSLLIKMVGANLTIWGCPACAAHPFCLLLPCFWIPWPYWVFT